MAARRQAPGTILLCPPEGRAGPPAELGTNPSRAPWHTTIGSVRRKTSCRLQLLREVLDSCCRRFWQLGPRAKSAQMPCSSSGQSIFVSLSLQRYLLSLPLLPATPFARFASTREQASTRRPALSKMASPFTSQAAQEAMKNAEPSREIPTTKGPSAHKPEPIEPDLYVARAGLIALHDQQCLGAVLGMPTPPSCPRRPGAPRRRPSAHACLVLPPVPVLVPPLAATAHFPHQVSQIGCTWVD